MKATLQAAPRDSKTRGDLRKLRSEGLVPGVLYGFGEPAEEIQIRLSDLRPVLKKSHGSTLLIDLAVGDREPVITVFREVQKHPVSHQILHCDLLKVDMSRKYHVTVPIVITGEAVGVKTFGGVLDIHIREIDVRCLPNEIPQSYVVDVSNLMIGDSVRVNQIGHGNEEFLTHAELAIVTCAQPRKIVEAAPVAAEGEAAAEGAAPEGEEKPEEGKESKEAKGGKEAREPRGKRGAEES
jgi:large subunit ribosomal protein L25